MPLDFSTKAQTLALLKERLRSARVAPLVTFTVAQWKRDPQSCLSSVSKALGAAPWIVRSSRQREDGLTASYAGAFLSVQNVSVDGLRASVEQVVASYGDADAADEVLVQPMLRSVVRSGVALTHDPSTCAAYRVINWCEGSDTAAVTGGRGGRTWQQAARSPHAPPGPLAGVVRLLEELLLLFDNVPVDCEFAVTHEKGGETVWLLQARPLILRSSPEGPEAQASRLETIHTKVKQGMRPHPFLKGKRTVYGVMPDWNPAEILGVRPKPLALSIYRDLVTDSNWAYQRHNYGYRNLRSFPLMVHFFGLPYIDVRLSFNSFIPADLEDELAGRLTDYYIDRLLDEPTLHDKVEFEIVFSCYTLDLPKRLSRLANSGFSDDDQRAISASLRRLTNRIVHTRDGLWREDASKLDILQARREELLSSSLSPLERAYWLIEDSKRYGTLPFAGLARAGFIAVQMLKSFVEIGLFSPSDYASFMGSVSTVSRQLVRDRATLDKSTFLARYGHLRPGTYDVLSARYDEAPELYFDWSQRPPLPPEVAPFSLTLPQLRELAKLLQSHGLELNPVEVLEFLQSAIELREYSKFLFSRNLSDALSLIGDMANQWGFSREELAYCEIGCFQELYVAAADPQDLLHHAIERGKARYRETLALSLPPLIRQPQDVWAFEWPETEPNFITHKQVVAPVCGANRGEKLAGAIVCIPNADPGFDWLFAYPIAGLVTAWGGANSHMAIRAGELGLPAAVGVGEINYREWSLARRLRLDCAGRRVEVLLS
jgi:hypothetical protein